MSLMDYFSLDISPEEPTLGPAAERAKKQARQRRRIALTLLMYAAVWLGVIGQNLMALYQARQGLDSLNPLVVLVALVIATVIFPAVFPKTFVRMPKAAQHVGTAGWRVVQFCVAFQQGFFWQALISLIAPKIPPG